MPWPVIEPLVSERLTLEPLSLDHARPMVDVLSDHTLYTFTGGEPPTLDTLSTRYASQIRGPADGSQAWFNWIARRQDTGALIGFVQATVESRARTRWPRSRGSSIQPTNAKASPLKRRPP